MKPRLRMVRGMWRCGLIGQSQLFWSVCDTPLAAYELWKRCQP